jgi:hypothetical protein
MRVLLVSILVLGYLGCLFNDTYHRQVQEVTKCENGSDPSHPKPEQTLQREL